MSEGIHANKPVNRIIPFKPDKCPTCGAEGDLDPDERFIKFPCKSIWGNRGDKGWLRLTGCHARFTQHSALSTQH